jgi:hypothetical protein
LEELVGVIVSQSRYLAYESTFPEKDRSCARAALRTSLLELWGESGRIPFQYRYESRVFHRRFV